MLQEVDLQVLVEVLRRKCERVIRQVLAVGPRDLAERMHSMAARPASLGKLQALTWEVQMAVLAVLRALMLEVQMAGLEVQTVLWEVQLVLLEALMVSKAVVPLVLEVLQRLVLSSALQDWGMRSQPAGHKESKQAGPEGRAQQQACSSSVAEAPARLQQPALGKSHFWALQELPVQPEVPVWPAWRWRVFQVSQVLVVAGWVRDWSWEEPAELWLVRAVGQRAQQARWASRCRPREPGLELAPRNCMAPTMGLLDSAVAASPGLMQLASARRPPRLAVPPPALQGSKLARQVLACLPQCPPTRGQSARGCSHPAAYPRKAEGLATARH